MSLVSRMTTVYDRIYPISDRLGVPNHVNFTFLDKVSQADINVLPRPKAGSPPVNKLTAWEKSGVEVNQDMLYVTGISRTYSSIKKGTFCKIDGKDYTIMWVSNDEIVTFSILLRPERNR